MKNRFFKKGLWAVTILIGLLTISTATSAEEVVQTWEVINPAGSVKIEPSKLAPRITTLEGKTIVLRWNSKHNGVNYLNRVAELLAKEVPSAKVIKLYEIEPSTNLISMSNEKAAGIAKKIADLKPDLVIASQAD